LQEAVAGYGSTIILEFGKYIRWNFLNLNRYSYMKNMIFRQADLRGFQNLGGLHRSNANYSISIYYKHKKQAFHDKPTCYFIYNIQINKKLNSYYDQ